MKPHVLWLLSLCLLLGLPAVADEPQVQLTLWAKSGSRLAKYALNKKPRMTFTESDIVITAGKFVARYTLNDIASFTYEKKTLVGITDLLSEETSYKLDGEMLLFPTLKQNSTVEIYTLEGTLILKRAILQNGEYALPLTNLTPGVYLIKVNGVTHKIMKK